MQYQDFGLWGLFASAFVSSTVAPGGSEVVLAFLVDTHRFPLIELVALATVGNTLGALTTWWFGAWTAKKRPVENMLSVERHRSLLHIKRWGNWALLLSWLPLIGDGLCFASGWLRLSFFSALLAIFIGKLLRYVAVAYAFV